MILSRTYEGKMLTIHESQLENFWKVRDVCQGIASTLNELSDESDLAEKNVLQNDYKKVSDIIDQMSSSGYFSKKEVSPKFIAELVNSIIEIENKNSHLAAMVWEKQITKVPNFKNNSFKFCVQPIFDDKFNKLSQNKNFISCKLISDKNIYINNPIYDLEEKENSLLSYGYIYDVTSKNFVAATDSASNIVIKKERDISDKDFLASSKRGDEYLYLNGYATKIRTPAEIIKKFSNERFSSNNNAVVLSGDSKPSGVFCFVHYFDFVNKKLNKAKIIASETNLPLIKVSIENYYKNNGKFFFNNQEARNCFNNYINLVVRDLDAYSGSDIFKEVRKLKGFNTNLRYNFIFKFILNIKKYLEGKMPENLKTFIKNAIIKTVSKRNELQDEREKENGGPLPYPTENLFIPLPLEFLNG